MPAIALKSPLRTCLFEQQRLLQQQMKLHFLDLALFHAIKLVMHICIHIQSSASGYLRDMQNLQFFSLHSCLNCSCHLLQNFQCFLAPGLWQELLLHLQEENLLQLSGRALQLPESHISKADTRGTSILMFPL